MHLFEFWLTEETEQIMKAKLKTKEKMDLWLENALKHAIISKFGEEAIGSEEEEELNSGSVEGGGCFELTQTKLKMK